MLLLLFEIMIEVLVDDRDAWDEAAFYIGG